MSETRIRVLLADDHAVVRAGYRRVLENTANMQVVAEAGSGEEAYALVKKVPVHVVVMDLTMDGLGGLEALRRIRARVPKVKVLIFSMHVTAAFANQAFQSGAAGYVTKVSDPGILVQAVREVHAGRRFLSPDIAKILALDNLGKARNPTQELTPREFEIFRMLAEGRKISEIALTLSLSQKTIANHCTQIKQRLDIKSDIELVRLAIRHAIVRVDGPAMKAI